MGFGDLVAPLVKVVGGGAAAGQSVFSSLLAAGGSLLGGYLNNQASAFAAQDQRDWAEKMRSTAHQTEVNDLMAAGLNPILSGTGGMGASTPGGPVAQTQDIVGPAVGSALAAKRLDADLELIKEQTTKTMQDTETGEAVAEQARSQTAKNLVDAAVGAEQEKNLAVDRRIKNIQVLSESERAQQAEAEKRIAQSEAIIAGSSAKRAVNEGEIEDTTYGKVMRYVDRALGAINGGSSAYSRMRR